MPPNSRAADALARRLLAPTTAPAGAADGPAGAVALAERVDRLLADELSRWLGPYGYHTLFTRALAESRAEHPALAAVRVRAPLEPYLDGLSEAARVHGAGATIAGVTAVLTAFVELLGRVIGEDMALNLVDRAVPSAAPNASAAATEGGRS